MTNNNSTYKRLGDYIREVDVRWFFAQEEESKKAVKKVFEELGYKL